MATGTAFGVAGGTPPQSPRRDRDTLRAFNVSFLLIFFEIDTPRAFSVSFEGIFFEIDTLRAFSVSELSRSHTHSFAGERKNC